MSNIIEFKQKHFKSGTVRCEHCAHEWIAVWPVNSEPLECPKCGLLEGREFYGPSLYDYVKLPNGATVTDALDAYLQGVKEGKKLAQPEQDEPVDISDKSEPTAAAILPNGVRVTNVYEAYIAGMFEGSRLTKLKTEQDDEPVAWVIPGGVTENKDLAEANGNSAKPLYLHPEPKVPFVRLTDEELENLGGKYVGPMSDGEFHLMVITQNALEEKNR